MKRKFVGFVMTCALIAAAHNLASADQPDGPRTGDLLDRKFKLVETIGDSGALCEEARDSLNRPTIYDGSDMAASFLQSDAAMMWQIFDRSIGGFRPIRTVGEFRSHRDRADRLELDLDGNGTAEQITREWLEVKSQTYTALSVGVEQPTQPITYHSLSAALGTANAKNLDSSFFLFEVVEFDRKPYVIALATIRAYTELNNRIAFVLHLNAAMQPEVDCIMKTIVYGDQ